MSAVRALLETFAEEHPSDVARLLDRGSAEDVAAVLTDLDSDKSARLLTKMNPSTAGKVLAVLDTEIASELLGEAGPSRAALMLTHVPEKIRRGLLAEMKGREAEAVRRLLVHTPNTAGSIMDAMVLSIADDASVHDALDSVKQHAEQAQFYLYVVDREQRLVGVATLRELLLAAPDAAVRDVMQDRPDSISAHATSLAVATHPGWRLYHALPVVDVHGVLVGAIRYETARNIERELGQAVKQSDVAQTAGSLAQLYAIGALGMVEWFTALSPSSRRKQRRS